MSITLFHEVISINNLELVLNYIYKLGQYMYIYTYMYIYSCEYCCIYILSGVGVEVYGSWNDVAPRMKSDADLEHLIYDAMIDRSSINPPLTVVSGTASQTGFQTSN